MPSGKPRAWSTGRYSCRAADARQQDDVEHQRRRRHRRRLPPRQHAQQQREQARSDVDPLARVSPNALLDGSRALALDAARVANRCSVRAMPSASGVMRVAELADRLAAVERPVVAEDLDRAARDQRRAAEQRDAQLLGGAEQRRRPETECAAAAAVR